MGHNVEVWSKESLSLKLFGVYRWEWGIYSHAAGRPRERTRGVG